MTATIWDKWLLAVSVIIIVFGTSLAFLGGTPVFDVFNAQVDAVFSPSSSTAYADLRAGCYGMLGATMAGWGIFLFFITKHPFRERQPWAFNCVVLGLLTWFVIDSAMSAAYKAYFNVLFNLAIAVLALVPVLMLRREFKK